ncbi:alpha/beta hydrolase [Nocardia brasiliensis]|uniref:Lysophospholipase n=1 Tax=Nocardia brasiliensis (strain ATCC 700358 / HUJEG-1) TaxID=1133849 RepID=K0F6J9_NOCB7|nr:alpha/beta hydrolase [Nocardia brasiliensis]AFU03086.1 lysophospholipase [Nocardia brasiliensis ATCC 700358]OCF87021.1 lysophospholipase [Nocardia brasiliensis]
MERPDYARFLPAEYRAEPLIEPLSTWWPWQGRRVHIARAVDPAATVRMMIIHGGGGYSGALWPLAALAAGAGVEVLAPDLPLYGDTVEPDPGSVRYEDWVELLVDLVRAEQAADARPLVLFGASMGGMLAYEVAARHGGIAHVLATCLLDPADPVARRAAVRIAWTSGFAPSALRVADPLFGRLRVPIRWLADMRNMSLDPALSRLCATDPKGGGVRVPLRFLSGFLDYRHTPPERFAAAPLTLVHPANDRWTPPESSLRFLRRIPARTAVVLLANCGHYPIEQPGLTQLEDTLRAVADTVRGTSIA